MSILVNKSTRVLVQGITGREGGFHTLRCMEYGTQVVAGVTPGRGGTIFEGVVPVFDSVIDGVKETEANTVLVLVPPPFFKDAAIEAAEAGVDLIVGITEGVPVMDTAKVVSYVNAKGVRLLGPNCPGIISPGDDCKVGIMPAYIHQAGRVGVVSRSGTLTYETVNQLSGMGIGQSTCIGIGGDSLIGMSFVDVLELFKQDSDTDLVVLIGEIGGSMEQEAADYIHREFNKPVVSFIAGASAPPGRRMGHAGAIITGDDATAAAKTRALEAAGVHIAKSPGDIGAVVERVISGITKKS